MFADLPRKSACIQIGDIYGKWISTLKIFPADSRRLKDTLMFADLFRVNLRAFKSATSAGNACYNLFTFLKILFEISALLKFTRSPSLNPESFR
jgi:hypothetical protein